MKATKKSTARSIATARPDDATAHLLRVPANARHLARALKEIERGELVEMGPLLKRR